MAKKEVIIKTKRNHVHAEMILEWLSDASLQVEHLQVRNGEWQLVMPADVTWNPLAVYRFRPKLLKIGEFEVEALIKESPEINSEYWLSLLGSGGPCAVKMHWNATLQEEDNLRKNRCFLTEKAAIDYLSAALATTASKSHY